MTIATMVMVGLALYMALLWAPFAKAFTAPITQKIFYFHVASAWVAYLAFAFVLALSIMVLMDRWTEMAHETAGAAAEIGIVFCTAAIMMGMTWGNQEWGTPWRWDDTKLTMTFVLWLVYIAYLTFRSSFIDERGKKNLALYGILGFICVPLSFVASRIWRSLHPNPVTETGGLSPMMGASMGVAVIAISMVFFVLLSMRIDMIKIRQSIEELKQEVEEGIK